MRLTLHRLVLPLAHPFTISRGSIHEQISLVVKLEHEGCCGYGEVTENSYYGHTYDSLAMTIASASDTLNEYSRRDPSDVWPQMLESVSGNHFAASAIDMAAHDLHARRNNLPTWKAWGLEWRDVPTSSYTIGIDTLPVMQQKLAERPNWGIYKIKLGTGDDVQIVRALRQTTNARFRVDANCGWTVDETIENSRELAKLDVEFIEQPLPASATRADKLRVFENSSLPIIADESCQREIDVQACHELFHGINVKICKCGGLTPALRMLRQARQLHMKTMVGCMIESSIGISGSAQLLPLLDYADLDGALLLAEDPALGIVVEDGKIERPTAVGTGASLRAK